MLSREPGQHPMTTCDDRCGGKKMPGKEKARHTTAVDERSEVWFQDVSTASVACGQCRVLRWVLGCVVSAYAKHSTVPWGSQNPLVPVMIYGLLRIELEVQPYGRDTILPEWDTKGHQNGVPRRYGQKQGC